MLRTIALAFVLATLAMTTSAKQWLPGTLALQGSAKSMETEPSLRERYDTFARMIKEEAQQSPIPEPTINRGAEDQRADYAITGSGSLTQGTATWRVSIKASSLDNADDKLLRY